MTSRATANDRQFFMKLIAGIGMIDWRMMIFCVVFFSTFTSLGFWQMDRAAQKVEMLTTLEEKRNQRPVENVKDPGNSLDEVDGIPVRLRGEYLPGSAILLDNVVFGGKVGFDLLVWFKEANTNRLFLVNRGFVAMARTRTEIPEMPPINAATNSLTGHIYARRYDNASLTAPVPIVTAENADTLGIEQGQVRIAQRAAPEFLAAGDPSIGAKASMVYPYLIRLTVGDPNGLPRNWILANIMPEKHTGYAIQWFLMALAILVLFIRLALKQQSTQDEKGV
mgnify:FL=1